ncbi:hypothetical protein ACFU76_35165 [Streptomyces sp. NPDC057539]|uniref:hypothetical protein n=1 Tax=Streptomyces sp. NPDC057539 TaxID=3346159 RepID=UPI003681CA1C
MWPDAIADALVRIEWAFRQSGRYLKASQVWQPGLEVEHARNDLEEVLLHLPSGARRDLGQLIARIDDEFERRTLPNPGPVNAFTVGGRWWPRIREHLGMAWRAWSAGGTYWIR